MVASSPEKRSPPGPKAKLSGLRIPNICRRRVRVMGRHIVAVLGGLLLPKFWPSLPGQAADVPQVAGLRVGSTYLPTPLRLPETSPTSTHCRYAVR